MLPNSQWHEAFYLAKQLYNFPKEFANSLFVTAVDSKAVIEATFVLILILLILLHFV